MIFFQSVIQGRTDRMTDWHTGPTDLEAEGKAVRERESDRKFNSKSLRNPLIFYRVREAVCKRPRASKIKPLQVLCFLFNLPFNLVEIILKTKLYQLYPN